MARDPDAPGKDRAPHDLEVHHDLVPEVIRQALWEVFCSTTLSGHAAFNRMALTIIGATLGGRITPEQAKAVTPLCELLFTSLAAEQMRNDAKEMAKLKASNNPLAATIAAAQARAKTIRPVYEIGQDGMAKAGLQLRDKEGRETGRLFEHDIAYALQPEDDEG